MNLKINENLLNKINKNTQYPNLIIKRKEIKIRNKDLVSNSMDVSPLAFSFSVEQKNSKLVNAIIKNNFMNSYIKKNLYNARLIKQYKRLYNKRNEENIKNKLFNKINSSNDSMDISINKENKKNILLKSFNDTKDNINCLMIHKKIFVLNKVPNSKADNTNLNTQRKTKKISLTNSASAKRYQTIFTKFIMNDLKFKEKSQEQGYNFELFSSKYNNLNKQEESKETQTPRKIFSNEELQKTTFNNNMNEKYLKTDSTVNYNHTLSVLLPKFVHMPNVENIKNFKINNKPTFYIQKNEVKQKIKSIMNHNKIFNDKNFFLNSSEKIKNKNKNNVKKNVFKQMLEKNSLKTNGIKFVSVNLNGLAKIPNRIIKLDRYGNQIQKIRSNTNKKRIFSQSDAFHLMKKSIINKYIISKSKQKK